MLVGSAGPIGARFCLMDLSAISLPASEPSVRMREDSCFFLDSHSLFLLFC